MKILNFWNQKGGVGKTTLALQTANYYAQTQKVAFIDLDPQRSATEVFQQKKMKNIDFYTENQKNMESLADVVIIDYPPGTSKIPARGVVVVAFRGSVLDFRSVRRALIFLKKQKKKVVSVLNCFRQNKTEHRKIRKYMQERSDFFVCLSDRSVYERATGQGFSIFHEEVKKIYGCQKARADFLKLIEKIEEI